MSLSLPRRLFRLFLPRIATFRQKATTRPVTLGCGRIAVPHERNSLRLERQPSCRRLPRSVADAFIAGTPTRAQRISPQPGDELDVSEKRFPARALPRPFDFEGVQGDIAATSFVSWTIDRVRSLGKERALELIGVHKDRLCEYACVQRNFEVLKWARNDLDLPWAPYPRWARERRRPRVAHAT